jgi:hypothetical protein
MKVWRSENSSVSSAARLRSPTSCSVTASVLPTCSRIVCSEWPSVVQSIAPVSTISSAKMVAAIR